MSFYALTGLINCISATVFGLLVFLKAPKKRLNQVFGLMTLAIAVWSFSYWRWLVAPDKSGAFLWAKVLNAGSIFIPVFYLHWILLLLGEKKKKNKILILGYSITFFSFVVNFTPFFIKDLAPILSFSWWPLAGPLYIFYLLFGYAGLILYGLYQLIKNYKSKTGYQRAQIKYIILATIIGFSGGATNFPLWYKITFPPVGNILISLYPLILAYAIIRYRLMDIRVVIGRTAVYLFSFASVVGLAFFLFWLNNFLPNPLSFKVVGPLIIIVSILVFRFVLRFFEKLASKYFYYTFYSYSQVLSELGRKLTRILDLDQLSDLIVKTLKETMKLDRTVVLLRNPETGDYQIQKNIGFKEENGISLVKDNFLTQYLERTQRPLVYEELSLLIRDAKNKEEKEKLENLKRNMKKIEAALCLPLVIENKITGLIVLGNKISRNPYSQQDVELLTNLANQSSIALQNAKLYSQVEDLSKNLEKKVREQTRELRKAYEELKVLDRAKSEFISMASHQLRTPLAAIKGYLSMLAEGSYGQLPEKAEEKMEKVLYSTERLVRIVNDLLNISKVELGKIEVKKQPTDIKELIASCYEELNLQAEKKNLKLILKKPKEKLPKLNIDSLKIRQVITNLIDNAIHYTQKGKIEITLQKTKRNTILISISDTGEGMTKEEQKNIFEGFTRGKAGINLFIEGAGLGLYVAKKFLQIHKGKIWAESEGKGKGSTFYVELPIE